MYFENSIHRSVSLEKHESQFPQKTLSSTTVLNMYNNMKGTLGTKSAYYTSQHLKRIKTFHQSCPKTKMCSCLRTTLMNLTSNVDYL